MSPNSAKMIKRRTLTTTNRPKKLRLWTNESMEGAMSAVKDGEMGVNRAALQFYISCTTLKDRLAGG